MLFNLLFEKEGYTLANAEELKQYYIVNALKKYCTGDYVLHNLDVFGQRIGISINIGKLVMKSGWMIEKNGVIKNITPMGGW